MELRTTLIGLSPRFPDLALVRDGDLAFRELSAVLSIESLPVTLG